MNFSVCRLDNHGEVGTFVLPDELAGMLKIVSGQLTRSPMTEKGSVLLDIWPFAQAERLPGDVEVLCDYDQTGRGPSMTDSTKASQEMVTDFVKAILAMVGGIDDLDWGFGPDNFFLGSSKDHFWVRITGMPSPVFLC